MRQLIGLSVSFCIQDIVDGKVTPIEVLSIVAGTKAGNKEAWEHLSADYEKTYWSKSPEYGAALLRMFVKKGIIVQPRLDDLDGPNISGGHWLVFDKEESNWYQCRTQYLPRG